MTEYPTGSISEQGSEFAHGTRIRIGIKRRQYPDMCIGKQYQTNTVPTKQFTFKARFLIHAYISDSRISYAMANAFKRLIAVGRLGRLSQTRAHREPPANEKTAPRTRRAAFVPRSRRLRCAWCGRGKRKSLASIFASGAARGGAWPRLLFAQGARIDKICYYGITPSTIV